MLILSVREQLVYAIKKLLHEMAQSVPWVKSSLMSDRKRGELMLVLCPAGPLLTPPGNIAQVFRAWKFNEAKRLTGQSELLNSGLRMS